MTSGNPQRGFAIVEVLFAVVVLTVLAVGVLGAERNGLGAARAGIEETAALLLLQERLEVARGAPAALEVGTRRIEVPAEIELLRGASIDETVAVLEPGLLEVRVRLRWPTDGRRAAADRELTTWVVREEEDR